MRHRELGGDVITVYVHVGSGDRGSSLTAGTYRTSTLLERKLVIKRLGSVRKRSDSKHSSSAYINHPMLALV
jgi:hypothetical protein